MVTAYLDLPFTNLEKLEKLEEKRKRKGKGKKQGRGQAYNCARGHMHMTDPQFLSLIVPQSLSVSLIPLLGGIAL